MNIYSAATDQRAYRVRDQHSKNLRYDCYLPNRLSNEKIHAHSFDSIEDAARFLLDNEGSGIRMNSGTAIISEKLIIARDEEEDTP